MIILHEPAFAKVNLTLDVLGKRPDGYHDLRSIMQTVSIRDDVTLTLGTKEPWKLTCNWEALPQGPENLAWKAAEVFFQNARRDPEGLTIDLFKRIPAQAGLGGGSADAAAVLRALNRHYDAPYSILALAELGSLVGSDVPFCVLGGTAMVEGMGEQLRKLPDLPECFFVVCKPDFSVSTPELYQKLDRTVIPKHPDHRAMESALLAGDLGKVADGIYNVFDPVVTQDHLELNYIKSILNTYGSLGQQMTGSGSAVYGMMPSFEFAAVACNMLKDHYPQIFIARSV